MSCEAIKFFSRSVSIVMEISCDNLDRCFLIEERIEVGYPAYKQTCLTLTIWKLISDSSS